MIFIGCSVNGYTAPTTAQGGCMSNRIWSLEDFPGRFGTFEGLDAETEFQIMMDFYNYYEIPFEFGLLRNSKTIEEFFALWNIAAYYGTFNGYLVIDYRGMFYVDRRARPPIRFAGGFIVGQNPAFQTTAWGNGKFYSLETLTEQGKLTQEDAQSIARLHPHWRPL